MNPTEPESTHVEQTFFAALAAMTLQRLFWLLIAGLATRVVVLAINHYAAASSDVLASMYWFDVLAIPPLIGLTWWLHRPDVLVRGRWRGWSGDAVPPGR